MQDVTVNKERKKTGRTTRRNDEMRGTDVQDMRARNTDAREFICKCVVIYAAQMIAAAVSMRTKDQLRQRPV